MAMETRKRSAEDDENEPDAKRQRVENPSDIVQFEGHRKLEHVSTLTTAEELARKGLRRGIALALQKVGFDGALPDALESFASMAEEYLSSLAEDVNTYANSARRSHPIPTDFELSFKRHNLSFDMLQPHKKPPIPRSKRLPKFEPLQINDPPELDLPILGGELDGSKDKLEKNYIPSSFPAFPSTHTYKYTAESIEAVAILKEPTADAASREWPLAPHEIPYGDPKKLREAAAKEAKAGEEALRKLMRASKVASQKESWASAQRDRARRDNHNAWESTMRELIEEDAKATGQEISAAEMHGEKGREGIADHSMIVTTERRTFRREAMRAGGRKMAIPSKLISRKY